jgi:ferritin-like metal-binding protein YciE
VIPGIARPVLFILSDFILIPNPLIPIRMNLQDFRSLYVSQLRDMYDSESQILSILPDMEMTARHTELKKVFREHRNETQRHVHRLEKIFDNLGEIPRGETCDATQGLIKEVKEIIASRGDTDVVDAGLIATAQRIEHYEIANYGTACTYARELKEKKAAKLLHKTLLEEKKTDKRLTGLAIHAINLDAQGGYTSPGNSAPGDKLASGAVILLAGLAAGVAIGMLLAPRTGAESRRLIASSADKWMAQLNAASRKLANAQKIIEQYGGQAKAAVAEVSKAAAR